MKAKRNKSFIPVIIALVVVIGVGLGVWQTGQASKIAAALTGATPTETNANETYKTTAARVGNISISINGSGNVISAQTADLGFSTTGKIAEIAVAVGDTVKAGQVLATLDGMEQLKFNIQEKQLAVLVAQKALDDLQTQAAANLAQAQKNAASAQEADAAAKANLHQKGDGRCATSKTQEYYGAYIAAQGRVDEWQGYLNDPNTGYGRDYILQKLAPMLKERDIAYANMKYCESYTDQEIKDSQAALQVANANVKQANAAYENLKNNSGIDPQAQEIAQAALKNAQLQLSMAQKDLAGATITAPIDGTVMKINGVVGNAAPKGALISISNLEQPQVQISMDETDLENFAVGCAADVTFDSLTGQTFPGIVTQVSPKLVTVQSVAMVQGLVELEKKTANDGKVLPLGLAANVEVACKQAKDVLIIPAQALYEAGSQSAYVYVLNDQGQPEKREVKVGLKTVALAEIQSGLKEGEPVITTQIVKK